jgi:hypothetical protein
MKTLGLSGRTLSPIAGSADHPLLVGGLLQSWPGPMTNDFCHKLVTQRAYIRRC